MHPDLKRNLNCLTYVNYVVTDEEDRVVKAIANSVVKSKKKGAPTVSVKIYNSAFGLIPVEQYQSSLRSRTHSRVDQQFANAIKAMETIFEEDTLNGIHFYIVTDPEQYLTSNDFVRRILNIIHQVNSDINIVKCIYFVGASLVVPPKLASYIHVIRDDYLAREEIQEVLDGLTERVRERLPEDAYKWFSGLTAYQVRSAAGQSIGTSKHDPDPEKRSTVTEDRVLSYKRERIRRTDLLKLVDVSAFTFDRIGGIDRFKKWALETRHAWTTEGKAYGLRPPKGVLAVGVWGCGKSLAVKALGNAWRLPTIQLELGKLRDSGVGNTEANTYRVIRHLESMAPCVTGDTLVTLADGTARPIEELWLESPAELRVMCWNERTLRVGETRVSGITRRVADAFRVSTANGFSLCATANHQHYVMRGGMPEWVRTDELQPGDMLAVPLLSYEGDEDCTRFHPVGMRNYSTDEGVELRRGGGGWRDARVPTLPDRWSADLGWILGLIEGDGWISSKGAIALANTSLVVLDAFERILMGMFGLATTRRETTDTHAQLPGLRPEPEFSPCWCSIVQNQLAAEFLCAARDGILSAPVEARAAFLAGWLDADGCVMFEKISLTVRGPKLRRERRILARQLIQSLGITPSKFDSKNMEITGSRANALAVVLHDRFVLKQDRAARVKKPSRLGFDRGMGFACGALLQEARKSSGLRWSDTRLPVGTTWGYENGRTPVSERHMATFIEALGDHAAKLRELLDAECRWVALREVEPVGEAVVYDLICEGQDTHSFIANGLITHNCIAWCDEAEKSFSGSHSSSYSDAGTTARALGILSTWHQETEAEVCLALTTNSLKTLPVEFTNRISERFFFDLPSEDDRVDILKIHLLQFGSLTKEQVGKFDLRRLAEASENLVPREMEQAVDAALRKSFAERKPHLDFEIFEHELRTKPRILKTMDTELREVLNWVGYDADSQDGLRARYASTKQSSSTMKFLAGGAE